MAVEFLSDQCAVVPNPYYLHGWAQWYKDWLWIGAIEDEGRNAADLISMYDAH